MVLNYKKAFGIGVLSQFVGAVLTTSIYNYFIFRFSNSNTGPSLGIFFVPGVVIAAGFSLYHYFKYKNDKDISKLVFVVIISILSGMLGAVLFSMFAGWAFSQASFNNM